MREAGLLSDTDDAPVSAWDSSLSPPRQRGRWRDVLVSLLVTLVLTAFFISEAGRNCFQERLAGSRLLDSRAGGVPARPLMVGARDTLAYLAPTGLLRTSGKRV
jgi:hypothetical protein